MWLKAYTFATFGKCKILVLRNNSHKCKWIHCIFYILFFSASPAPVPLCRLFVALKKRPSFGSLIPLSFRFFFIRTSIGSDLSNGVMIPPGLTSKLSCSREGSKLCDNFASKACSKKHRRCSLLWPLVLSHNRWTAMLRFFSRFQADFQLKSGWIEPLLVGGHAPFSPLRIYIFYVFTLCM